MSTLQGSLIAEKESLNCWKSILKKPASESFFFSRSEYCRTNRHPCGKKRRELPPGISCGYLWLENNGSRSVDSTEAAVRAPIISLTLLLTGSASRETKSDWPSFKFDRKQLPSKFFSPLLSKHFLWTCEIICNIFGQHFILCARLHPCSSSMGFTVFIILS